MLNRGIRAGIGAFVGMLLGNVIGGVFDIVLLFILPTFIIIDDATTHAATIYLVIAALTGMLTNLLMALIIMRVTELGYRFGKAQVLTVAGLLGLLTGTAVFLSMLWVGIITPNIGMLSGSLMGCVLGAVIGWGQHEADQDQLRSRQFDEFYRRKSNSI